MERGFAHQGARVAETSNLALHSDGASEEAFGANNVGCQ